MDFKSTLEQIEERLKKLSMLNDELEGQGMISLLQSDLAKSHLRELYNQYSELMLASVSGQQQQVAPSISEDPEPGREEEEQVNDPVELEPVAEPIRKPFEQEEHAATEEVNEKPEPEQVPKSQSMPETKDPEELLAVEERTVPEVEQDKVSLLERFQGDASGKEINKSVHRNKPLKQLIPLNDKFMFIREFFANTIADYEQFLEIIEPLESKTDVLNYMQDHVWNEQALEEKQEAIERFIQIIDLRFHD